MQQKVFNSIFNITIFFIANPELIRLNNAKYVFQNRLPFPLKEKRQGEPIQEKVEQKPFKRPIKYAQKRRNVL